MSLDRNLSIGTVDPALLWEIINDDIPELEKYCNLILEMCNK